MSCPGWNFLTQIYCCKVPLCPSQKILWIKIAWKAHSFVHWKQNRFSNREVFIFCVGLQLNEKIHCFGLCLAVYLNSEVNSPTLLLGSNQHCLVGLHLFIYVNRLRETLLRGGWGWVSVILFTPTRTCIWTLKSGQNKAIFPLQWLSSHTKPSTLVVFKRDWWSSPPSLTDFNESSLSESTGRRGRRSIEQQEGCMQSNWYNASYFTFHLNHSRVGSLVDWLALSLACLLHLLIAVGVLWVGLYCVCIMLWHIIEGEISKTSWKLNKLNAVTTLLSPWKTQPQKYSLWYFVEAYMFLMFVAPRCCELIPQVIFSSAAPCLHAQPKRIRRIEVALHYSLVSSISRSWDYLE